jgi:fructosamine-3-kinase
MVDLAMVSLFGSLPAGFVQAWRASGIDHTSVRERIAVGQLLHLLNHARLFGRSYVPGVLERVDQLT